MTFKGNKIVGKPTLCLIERYIMEKGLFCEPQEVYDYWENKLWMTIKHREVKTLEAAIDCYNSIAVQRETNRIAKSKGVTKLNKKQKKREKARIKRDLLSGKMKPSDLTDNDNQNQINKDKKSKVSYDDQLKDKRWQSFRKFVLDVRGRKCEMCGSTEILQIHHPKYIRGRLAWEYTCNDVIVLCKNCHAKVHNKKE